jgi:hypothetical protein
LSDSASTDFLIFGSADTVGGTGGGGGSNYGRFKFRRVVFCFSSSARFTDEDFSNAAAVVLRTYFFID